MKHKTICATAMALLLPLSSMAGSLTAPISFPSTSVLPKGVRNVSFKGIMAQANNKYDGSGNLQQLGNSFETPLTYQDLIDNEKTTNDKLSAEAKLYSLGLNADDSLGQTTGKVNVAVNVNTPILAYGLNNNLTVAVAVPIVSSETHADVGAISDDSLQAAADVLTQPGQGMTNKVLEVQDKLKNAVANELSEKGYYPIDDEKKTQLGDISLIGKYRVQTFNQDIALAFEGSLTLPTGRKRDINRIVDVAGGDGQTDVGFKLISDVRTSDNFTLSGSIGYVAQLSDTNKERIREKMDSTLSGDIDPNTERDLGDIFSTHIAGNYSLGDSIGILAGYSYQYKEEDYYSGNLYSEQRYDWQGINTRQQMHAASFGLTYSTVEAYKKKTFFLPMEAGITHSRVLSGKNVIDDPLTTFDLKVYF